MLPLQSLLSFSSLDSMLQSPPGLPGLLSSHFHHLGGEVGGVGSTSPCRAACLLLERVFRRSGRRVFLCSLVFTTVRFLMHSTPLRGRSLAPVTPPELTGWSLRSSRNDISHYSENRESLLFDWEGTRVSLALDAFPTPPRSLLGLLTYSTAVFLHLPKIDFPMITCD